MLPRYGIIHSISNHLLMMAEGFLKGDLAEAINGSFGSLDAFKEQFNKAAATLFGAGWAWLVKKEDGTLQIVQESNAGNPFVKD